ncbi:MAG: hypothetical protein OWQ59_10680 [Alicyclobacillaceae bacterium]|jgi:hypothetical protein|uniref:hypothetical protein n=1 Tax=Alicyclobacillus sp. SP_1 TaxID=2942475 RepID=UPI00215809EC|nr:hypothetical protein [Alicyclobacillus sp. SP_1]MCY0888904.1 hypothetical protein [Alicyclobacillaceae bacterium]MCY0896322.1 hypothetical protein [Alicyclobacillaceae bacterium]
MGLFIALARFVKLLLAIAIMLLFLRALIWPNTLDLLILMILFVVFAATFFGAP